MIRNVLFFIFLCAFCWTQGKIDGVVAVVGKNIILHSDVLQQSRLIAINKKIDAVKNPYLFENIYQETWFLTLLCVLIAALILKKTTLLLGKKHKKTKQLFIFVVKQHVMIR